MKKRTMIVIFSVVIVALTVALIWGISVQDGWHSHYLGGPFDDAGLGKGVSFEYPVSDISRLDLQLTSEAVRIEPTDGSILRIEQTAERDIPEAFQIRCGLRGDQLTVRGGPHDIVSCGFNDILYSQVTLQVPRDAVLALQLDTASGAVSAADLAFDAVEIATASGDMDLRDVRAAETVCSAASGSVRITGSELQTLRCSTASGGITVDAAVEGEAELSSLSGSQSFQGSAGSLRAEAASGRISADADVRGTVHLETMSGGQSFSGRCSDLSLEAASGDARAEVRGAATIEAESASGTVELICPDVSRLELVEADTASGNVMLSVPEGTALSLDYDSASGQLNLGEMAGLLSGSGIKVKVSTMSGDLILRALQD